jgi:N-acetyl-gamma-glutamyl-phosphate reductase
LNGAVIADSKSGVSGAGRSPSLKTHFVEANENLSPYSIGRAHRHLPEMEQELRALDAHGGTWHVIFAPHLAPVSRGMLSTIYVTLPEGVEEADVRQRYTRLYADEPLTYVLPAGQTASFGHTAHTNTCAIGLTPVPGTRQLIITASIDNLGKGASGQAVQNMNVMYGLAETTGLL